MLISSGVNHTVKSASFILLQGVPTSVSLDALRRDIEGIEGVLSLHELHVWQLSENKIVASVHVCVAHQGEQGSRAFMDVSGEIRRVLHEYGIHSSTIQPEFFTNDGHGTGSRPGSGTVGRNPLKSGSRVFLNDDLENSRLHRVGFLVHQEEIAPLRLNAVVSKTIASFFFFELT